ncbi:MAG: hypothetical protein ACP5DC_03770 [Halothiobacillaceae bacterium]
MNCPDFVPEAARSYISALLEGDSWEPMGWRAVLDSAEEALSSLKSNGTNTDEQRKQIAEAKAHRDEVADSVACLERLAIDERMKKPYQLLAEEFTENQQWERFIHAAWAARMDYSKYRDRVKRATEVKGKIAQKAEELAALIRQIGDTGVDAPGELFSMAELLRQTDSGERRPSDRILWRGLRKHVLGDLPERESTELMQNHPIKIERVAAENVQISPEEQARNTARYSWGIAPSVPACLETIANVARQFRPKETGAIGAAIQTRQRSDKTEYVRAFGQIMEQSQGRTLTVITLKAMALVANVVINLPDVDVSYDDVRKALEKR